MSTIAFRACAMSACLLLGLASAALSAQPVIVPASGGNAVRVVDLDAGSVTASLAVGGDAYGLAVRRDGGRAWASQVFGAQVSGVGFDPPAAQTVAVPFTTHGSAVSADGRTLYVAIRDGSQVAVLDAATLAEGPRLSGFSNPGGIHVDPQGRYVAITNYGVPRLTVVGLPGGVQRHVPLPGVGGWGLAGSRDGSRLYVQGAGGWLAEVDPLLATTVRSIPATAAEGMLALTPDGARLYYAPQNGPLEVFDTASLAAQAPLATGPAALVDVSADGSRVWVGRPSIGQLTAYATTDGTELADIAVPGISRATGRFIPSAPGAIALWDLDDSGAGQPGQPTLTFDGTPGYVAGAVGRGALACGGTTTGASGGLVSPDGTDALTTALWITPRTLPAAPVFVAGQAQSTPAAGWWIALAGDRLRVHGLAAQPLEATRPLQAGRWHHVAVVADSTQVTVYVDAVVAGSAARIPVAATPTPFRLCADAAISPAGLDGALDAVAVYARALPAGEIAALAAASPRTAAALPNPGFEGVAADTTMNAIAGWRFASYNRNDAGDYGPNPTGTVEARVVDLRRRSGATALRSFARVNNGGVGDDANGRKATLVMGLPDDLRLSSRAAAIELWRSEWTWTTSSRWYHRLAVVLGDNRSQHEILLYCRAWGNGEGCDGNFQDSSNGSMTGADGTPWFRHRIEIPAGLDRDRLWMRIEHQQDAWDFTSADSTVHIDDVALEDELAVASFANNRVQFYTRGGSGNLVPSRSIAGSNTQLNQPNGVAFSDTELFVGNHGGQSILVFPRDAAGNVAPTRVIAGSNTGLGLVTHMRVFDRELYVASYGAPFRVFDTHVGGNVAPKRILPAMSGAYGIAVDANELFLSRHPDTGDQTIYVYARTATGSTPPLRTLQGVAMNFPSGLALTSTELIVSEYFNNIVRVFDRNASGANPGLRQFYDPGGLFDPVDVWYRDGEIHVAARASNSIRVYPLDAQGEVAARRVIAGAATGLDQPIAVIDSAPPGRAEVIFGNGFEAP